MTIFPADAADPTTGGVPVQSSSGTVIDGAAATTTIVFDPTTHKIVTPDTGTASFSNA